VASHPPLTKRNRSSWGRIEESLVAVSRTPARTEGAVSAAAPNRVEGRDGESEEGPVGIGEASVMTDTLTRLGPVGVLTTLMLSWCEALFA